MEKIFQYANFIMAISIFLLWITLAVIILVAWIWSKIGQNKFFQAAEKSLKFEGINECARGITNDFEVYRNHRLGFRSKTVIELCQELEQKLKLKDENNYIAKLEDIISLFKDNYRFDDDKINDVINNIKDKSGEEDARMTREYLIRVNAFYDGIVFEKDRSIKDIQEKMNRRKWLNRLCGILGFIGSIASIYGIFK